MLKVDTIYGVNNTGFNVDNMLYVKDGNLTCKDFILKINNYKYPSKSDLYHYSNGIHKIIEKYEESKNERN